MEPPTALCGDCAAIMRLNALIALYHVAIELISASDFSLFHVEHPRIAHEARDLGL